MDHQGNPLTPAEVLQRRRQVVRAVLGVRSALGPQRSCAEAAAPANVALVKYWGKRDEVLNLPVTDSLSVSLGRLGTWMKIAVAERDRLILDGREHSPDTQEYRRMFEFFDLFRGEAGPFLEIVTRNTVPTAAGVASSASAFAAAVRCLDVLMGWGLSEQELSTLARLGSGSACRSLWYGFVHWHRGKRADGLDSHGEWIPVVWPSLRVLLWVVEGGPKGRSSRDAMRHCVTNSPLYSAWAPLVARDLPVALRAIQEQNLRELGPLAEGNALAMHAIMIAARPSVRYWTPATLVALEQVERWREEGLDVWCTMDAGPNLKLLAEESTARELVRRQPDLQLVDPFEQVSVVDSSQPGFQ